LSIKHRSYVIVVVGIAAVIAVFVWAGGSASSSPTVNIHGSVNLSILQSVDSVKAAEGVPDNATLAQLFSVGDICQGMDGYANVETGMPVAVEGPKGQQVGTASLSAGSETSGGYCSFSFSVWVPQQSQYTLDLGSYGKVVMSSEDVKNGDVLTFGS
jgi:hypothetical protein